MFFATAFIYAQDDEAEIEELDEVPSLDDIIDRPGDSGSSQADDFKNAVFDLYDKVIESRIAGEANGYAEEGPKLVSYGLEVGQLIKSFGILMRNRNNLDGNRLQKGKAYLFLSTSVRKALAQTLAHYKYMKSQFTDEEWAAMEMEAAKDSEMAEEVTDMVEEVIDDRVQENDE
jgi:hypothetical protein